MIAESSLLLFFFSFSHDRGISLFTTFTSVCCMFVFVQLSIMFRCVLSHFGFVITVVTVPLRFLCNLDTMCGMTR
jgi:hypothetical protein